MNAIQLRLRVDELIDRTRTTRHSDTEYYNSINGAVLQVVKDRVEAIRPPKKYSVQSSERVRAELYTLVPAPVSATTVTGIVPYPADYYYYLRMSIFTNATAVTDCIPTNYGEVGLLDENPFKRPTLIKPYFNELATGLQVENGGTATFNYSLYYVKNPATISIGYERDKISTVTALTNAVVYYVYEDATYNATVTTGGGATVTAGQVLQAGETFTATGANLLTGTVIINTKIVECDLPVNLHEEICLLAAAKLSGDVEDYNKKIDLTKEVERN